MTDNTVLLTGNERKGVFVSSLYFINLAGLSRNCAVCGPSDWINSGASTKGGPLGSV